MRRKAAQSKRVSAAAICVVAGWLALLPPWGEGLRLLSYELPFLVRKPVRPEGAVILYMDDDSHVKLNGGTNWFRSWDRNQHAELIQKLAPLRPKLIVFDILFDAASSPETDRQLVDAIVQNGKVVAAAKLTPNIHEGEIIGFKVTKPFDSRIPWGVAETAADDEMVRQDFRDNVAGTPSLALKAAQLSGVDLPRDPDAPRWINYYGPPGTIPFHSYYEAISNQLSAAEISNKVVFVGAKYNIGWTGGKGTDDFRTPFTRSSGLKSPGVEVVATTYLNLLRRDWLVEIPRWSELLLLIVTGLAIGYGCATRPPGKAVLNGLLLFLLLAAIASLLTWTTGVWFAWLIPGLVQIPVALVFAFAAYATRLHLEKQLLERQLALHDSNPSPRPAGTPGSSPLPLARPAEFYVEPALANSTAAALAAATAPQRTAPVVPDHTLIRKIGQGAYGEVWVAKDIIGSYQAAKVVYENRFGEVIPFEREFRGIQKFTPVSRTNDSFVQILHVGRSEAGGYFYYLMELADDAQNGAKIDPATYVPKTLARELSLHGRVPSQRCLEWALELASALERLHQHGLIHRDIKPSNIIFIRGRPKLADIGLVTDIAGTGKDVTMLGTQGYIAPEGPGTPGADVYSLGKVLYEALTGLDRANFPELPSMLLAETQDLLILELNRIILKACEPEPGKRYKSAADLHLDLLKVRANARTETAKS
jgi:CHASE2 domain-containing sensor protein